MRFRVTMKDPDVLHEAVQGAVWGMSFDGLTASEAANVRGMRAEEIRKFASRWFEYGEYLTVEIDTEKETIVVVESGGRTAP